MGGSGSGSRNVTRFSRGAGEDGCPRRRTPFTRRATREHHAEVGVQGVSPGSCQKPSAAHAARRERAVKGDFHRSLQASPGLDRELEIDDRAVKIARGDELVMTWFWRSRSVRHFGINLIYVHLESDVGTLATWVYVSFHVEQPSCTAIALYQSKPRRAKEH